MAEKRKHRDVEEAGKAWTAWVAEQKKKGIGAVHAFVNRKEEILDLAVRTREGWSASPQDIVDEDTRMWQRVWNPKEEEATDAWRTQELGREDMLAPLGADQLRRRRGT